jgi:hypothetical protein
MIYHLAAVRALLMSATIAAGISSLPANAQSNVLLGVAGTKCTAVTKAGSENVSGTVYPIQLFLLTWSQGYLNALSDIELHLETASADALTSNLKTTSSITLAEGIAQACRSQPLLNLRAVTFQMYRQLGGRRFAMN